jgi:hypothetical protein
MGFNWVGAARGVDEALATQIKRQMEQEKMALANRQLEAEIEGTNAQRDINRMNAESLQDSRKSAAEERQARIGEKEERAAALKRRNEWAAGVVQGASQKPAQPGDWQSALELARARNILATGEDLPDSAISQIMASYSKNPNDRLLSPDEEAQQVRIARERAKATASFRAPSTANDERAARREHMVATNNYIAWLLQENKGNVDAALKHFDMSPHVAQRKGGGFISIADMRKLLEHSQGKPLTAEEQMKKQAAEAAARVAGVAGRGEGR